MLRALNENVVLRKHEAEPAEQKGIFLPQAKESLYEVIDSAAQDILRGDLVIVRKEHLYSVNHEGEELFVCAQENVLAKYVK